MQPLCPSFHCADGALLIGVLGPDGTVGYLNPAPAIDPEFVATAEQQARPAEQRFRFAGPCATSSCSYWKDDRCGVVDAAVRAAAELSTEAESVEAGALPRCAIRANCRWFEQRGRAACQVCPEVYNYRPTAAVRRAVPIPLTSYRPSDQVREQ